MPRGRGWPNPGRPPVHVRYGRPLSAGEDENTLAFNARVADAVGRLLDEDRTDWYAAARRAAAGTTPASAGPDDGELAAGVGRLGGRRGTARAPRAWR